MLEGDALRKKIGGILNTGISQAKIAREINISRTVFSRWMLGKYLGSNLNLEKAIRRWLGDRDDTQRPKTLKKIDYLPTLTAKKILSALTYAHKAKDIAAIYGGAGLGKTTAIKYYAANNPRTWVVTATASSSNSNAILNKIAITLGIHNTSRWTSRVELEVMERLGTAQGFLIIDEAQHLDYKALDTIRALHDEAEMGMALVGNELVYSRLTGGQGIRAAYLAQLFSRVGKRLHLVRPTAEDVDTLCDHWELGRAERAFLKKISKKAGALRGVVKTHRLAAILAEGEGVRLEQRHLALAWNDLCGNPA